MPQFHILYKFLITSTAPDIIKRTITSFFTIFSSKYSAHFIPENSPTSIKGISMKDCLRDDKVITPMIQ